MKINAIADNTNFQGTFKYNATLDECIRHSKNRDLKKFEKCLKKMGMVNDGWNYSLNFNVSMNNEETLERTAELVLASNSLGTASFRRIGEETVGYLDNFKGNYYKNALKKIVSIIKADYKKAEAFNDRKSIKSRIYNLLGGISKENAENTSK